tara:strand:- start:725 stop:910 length:186 start_codon:yes stop_codon:yes gene_type:complete
MTDISKKFKRIIENENLFKENPIVMQRLKKLVDSKKSFEHITEDELEALYIYLVRHNLPQS